MTHYNRCMKTITPQKYDMKDFVFNELDKYRGIWPKIAKLSGVSYPWICAMKHGSRTRLQIDSLQAVNDVLIDLANGDIPLTKDDIMKMQKHAKDS